MELPEGRITGRSSFQDLVRTALEQAAEAHWPELILCDPDFLDWPLGERRVIEALNRWARGGRQMRLMACSYRQMTLTHPRFVQWRSTWGHLLDCRVVAPAEKSASGLSWLWSPTWSLQRIDIERDVMVCSSARVDCQQARLTLDELYRQSTPGFPASVLGL